MPALARGEPAGARASAWVLVRRDRRRVLGGRRCVSCDEEAVAVEANVCLPLGDGCSRYVSTLVTGDGILAVWEQGQADGSQPLVGRSMPMEQVEQILGGC